MKTDYFLMTFFLFVSLHAITGRSSEIKITQEDQRILGEYVFKEVKAGAKLKDAKKIHTNEYFELFIALASLRNELSREYLVKCLPFYKGAAPGAFYADLVAKQGDEIYSALINSKKEKNVCDGSEFRCSSHSVDEIVARIKSKNYSSANKDNIGDSFSYWDVKKIQEKINDIKEYGL